MGLKFSRRVENFVCAKCGNKVQGTGYTNHCPKCLYSRHVDINPGDRLASCQGLMEPIKLEVEKEEYIITHRCRKCGLEKRNKAQKDDNFEEIRKLSAV